MLLNRFSEVACPADLIAVAINRNNKEPHCGIVYPDAAGQVLMCDMQFEHQLGLRRPPNDYIWVPVRLEPEEVIQIAEFVELVIEQHRLHPLRYSFSYAPDGFDVTGRLRDGVGVTCATFIVNIFDRLRLTFVDMGTWRSRPVQDSAFRERIVRYAVECGNLALARRLLAEHQAFRLKPWEVCGSATHNRYPVKFRQATKLAKVVSKFVHKISKRN